MLQRQAVKPGYKSNIKDKSVSGSKSIRGQGMFVLLYLPRDQSDINLLLYNIHLHDYF